MRLRNFGLVLVALLAAGPAAAHHDATVLGTVTLPQAARFGGVTLQPGTYELRDTGMHPAPLPGQSPEALTTIEFVRDGMVAARGAVEVIEGGAGTAGMPGEPRPLRVETLRGGEFMRISANRGGMRYLVHLATGASTGPAPSTTEPAGNPR